MPSRIYTPGKPPLSLATDHRLNDVPLDFLKRYITFGTNRIFLHPCFVPNYYVAVDPTVVSEDFVRAVTLLPSTKFLSEKFSKLIPGAITIRTTTEKYFFKDNLFWEGWTVTFVALQLAYMMGFTTVLLVGVDHRYKQGQKNHFHQDYEDGMYWVKHDMTNIHTSL